MNRPNKRPKPPYTGLTPPLELPEEELSRLADSDDQNANCDQVLDVSAPSWSGHFIQLEQEGKLEQLLELWGHREKLRRKLQTTEIDLSQFGNPLWLLESYIRIRNTGDRFGPRLKAQARALEERKKKLATELSEVEREISLIDPMILSVVPKPALEPSLPVRLPGIAANENAFVLVRDYLIKQASALGWSDEQICTRLDGELARRGEPPVGIPQKWADDYGEQWNKPTPDWKFYSAAYNDKRTKNLMQKMISKAKVRIP